MVRDIRIIHTSSETLHASENLLVQYMHHIARQFGKRDLWRILILVRRSLVSFLQICIGQKIRQILVWQSTIHSLKLSRYMVQSVPYNPVRC